MKNRLSYMLLIALMAYSAAASAQNEPITLEKLYVDGYFRPATITRGVSMHDGLRYSLIRNRTELNIHDYETGTFLKRAFSTTGQIKDTLGNARAIDDYSFSPDEKKVLIGVNEKRIFRRSREAEYYIADLETGQVQRLASETSIRLPDFSPDGSKVAYVSKNNIFVKDLLADETVQVTTDGLDNEIINGTTDWVYEEEFGFTKGFHWSPDGRYIAYYRFDESHVKEFSMVLYGTLYPEMKRFKYPKAGEDNAFVSIHIYDLHSGRSVKADTGGPGDYYIPRIQWTSDPGQLAIQKLNRHQNRLEIMLATAGTGDVSLLYVENNLWYIDITDDLTFLRDGRHFLVSSEKSGFNHLYLYDMLGREVRPLTAGEYDVEKFLGVDETKGLVYYLAKEESPLVNEIYAVRLNGRGKECLASGGGINNPSFSRGFKYFINEFSTLNSPPVYSIHKADGTLLKVLEDNARLAERASRHAFGEWEFFKFATGEGVELNGMILKPGDFDPVKKYPVLVYAYGGPGSQTVVSRWNAVNGVWFQMLAQQGFIIVSVDNRGTGFRGEQFKKMTYLELGKYESIDQVETARYLATLDFVDPGRIGIFGWSYGGYLSSLSLAKSAGAFAAAIAVAPVTSWRFYDTVYTERYMRTPAENPRGYDDNSPLSHAARIEGTLLLVHGCADDNVHFQNTMEMSRALIQANVQFEMMVYPTCNHGIGETQSRMHLYTLMTEFLNRKLN